jgi:hypothetical protein
MNSKTPFYLAVAIALFSLLIAVIALYQVKTVRSLALSDISIEENNSLVTPLFDEGSGSWSFLALYEIHVNNLSGPEVQWLTLSQEQKGSGFLVGLRNGEYISEKLHYQAFICERNLAEIQANPKLIREVVKNEMAARVAMSHTIKAGESKAIRIGVLVQPYDQNQKQLVDMVLLSYGLDFDQDRHYTFRRAFPVPPLKSE